MQDKGMGDTAAGDADEAGYLAIANPAAGGGRCGKRAPAVVQRLRDAGLDVTLRWTEQPGDGTRLAHEGFEQGYRSFLAGGGDGTAFEVLNGCLPSAFEQDDPVRLGFLPLGTGNAFLQDFTKERTEYAVHCLIDDQRRFVDVVTLHHTEGQLHFINLIGFGLPANVTIRAAGGLKKLGALGYILGVFLAVAGLDYRKLPMVLADGTRLDQPVTQVTVSNSRFTANGMLIAPQAELQDGLVDIVTVAPMSRFAIVRAFPTLFKGTHVLLDTISVHQTPSITFEVEEPIELMIDGEIRKIIPERIEVQNKALEVWA